MDPFNGTWKIHFTKETASSFKGTRKHTVIKCDFKVESMVWEINYIKKFTYPSSSIILLQLVSSPCVYYRTADLDIYELVLFDMLDDEDPWIRTTYFAPSGVFDRCNSYRISIAPRFDSYSFFCINYKGGISFQVMFLVNAIVHNAIMNQHQLLNKLFDMLRMQTRQVNVTALKHICSYKHLVFDACKRLKIVQASLLKNLKLLESSKRSDDSAEVRRLVITSTKAYILLAKQDIVDFFTRHMVNENLGVICNACVVHADQSEYGVVDEKYIELAKLAATTIDFPKIGKLVTMPQVPKPNIYLDFMGKSESQLNNKIKILGKFYRKINDASEEVPASLELTCATEDIPNDADFEIPGLAAFLEDAWNKKFTYEEQLNTLLGQYKVNREEEVVMGHIWSMPKHNSRNQGKLKNRLKHAHSALKREFKQIFENVSRLPETCG